MIQQISMFEKLFRRNKIGQYQLENLIPSSELAQNKLGKTTLDLREKIEKKKKKLRIFFLKYFIFIRATLKLVNALVNFTGKYLI